MDFHGDALLAKGGNAAPTSKSRRCGAAIWLGAPIATYLDREFVVLSAPQAVLTGSD
jgi:hypothetical protein